MVEFRLLGDVEVRIGGHLVEVGPARQRCVLVVLLVEANRVVPVDALVDRVWADRAPQRARNGMSGYLSRLRRVLAGTDQARIVRRPGGYVLTVDPLSVDLHRFDHLVAAARAAADAEAAAALLGEALGLWRGEAFATLDTPWLATVRAAADARRLAAVLDRNDLALDRGEHAGLLAELSAYAAGCPLDERLAGQLMLALYRCGRQADALQHYEQLRAGLAEELGADPGPGLQLLHKQILTADPTLTVPTSATSRSTPAPAQPPVPRHLPAPPRSFAGRAGELAELDAILAATGEQPAAVVVSAVSGTAGVGKPKSGL